MSQVITAFEETIVNFIRREGVVSTASVACRFGLDMRDARRELNRLHKGGLITSQREIFDYAAMNGWQIAEAAP
jgi:Mn-dependent DtxR family transcriptional regulator